MRRSTASFVVLVVATAASLFSPGCAEEPPVERLVVHADDPARPRAMLDGSPVLVPDLLDVAGTIASDARGRSVGRKVVIVDAKGERRDVVSGANGGFACEHVISPYDLLVQPVGEGPAVAYLGLQRDDPVISLFERDLDDPLPEQTLRVALRLDRSPCATKKGWVTVVSTSSWGAGTTIAPCMTGEQGLVVDVEHVIDDSVGADGMSVHVLVEDEAGASYAYARKDFAPSDAGAVTEVGMLEPLPIGFGPWVTIRASGEASLLPDWHWMTAVSLDLAGNGGRHGGALLLNVAEGNEMRTRLPAVPGATMSAGVFGAHPKSDGESPFYRSSEAWSGTRSLTNKPLELPVAAGPDVLRPKEGEQLAAGDLALEWNERTTRSTAILSVRNPAGILFQVVTEEHTTALARLDALGVRRLDAGDYALEMAAFPEARVDDLTSPVLAIRSRRFDRSRAGASTLLRIPFQVVDAE